MRAYIAVALLCVALVGCGGAAPTPTINAVATQTREAEVAQVATLSAPTNTPVPPTSTPIPPTTTPAPPTATLLPPTATRPPTPTPTATLRPPTQTPIPAAQKWHDLPIPAGAVLAQTLPSGSVLFDVPQNELVVAAFMKREWEALGLLPSGTQQTGGILFHTYSYPTNLLHLVSYGIAPVDSKSCVIALIDSP